MFTQKTFPLYDWWYSPETAGIDDPQLIIKAIVESRGLLDTKAEYHSPHLLPGIKAAVERISRAVRDGEKILVHGDYDVDGIVGAVILFKFLKTANANPLVFLPTRKAHGYGLALDAIEKAKKEGITLIVTVDCGIGDSENVSLGKKYGIDFVLTDHHQVPDNLPDVTALVHTSLPGSEYPFDSLSGAAVAFKLIQALSEYMGKEINQQEYLPYIALSTITDVMPLIDENRLFVRDGIKALLSGYAPHIELLAKAGGYSLGQIGPRELGIHVGSRLNAPGRLVSPVLSAKFLMESNPQRMTKIALKIEQLNHQRREVQEDVAHKALEKVQGETDLPVHVLWDEEWHEGLLGTAAAKVAEDTGHPAILFTRCEDSLFRGSGRTLEDIDLFNLLTEFSGMYVHFGGHSGACGITIEEENLGKFRSGLIEHVNKLYPDGFPTPRLDICAKLSIDNVNIRLIEKLNILEPCGKGNPRPVFEFSPVCIERANYVGGGNHLRLDLKSRNRRFKGIAFKVNGIRLGDIIGRAVSIAATPVINEFNGRKSVEFHVYDLSFLD